MIVSNVLIFILSTNNSINADLLKMFASQHEIFHNFAATDFRCLANSADLSKSPSPSIAMNMKAPTNMNKTEKLINFIYCLLSFLHFPPIVTLSLLLQMVESCTKFHPHPISSRKLSIKLSRHSTSSLFCHIIILYKNFKSPMAINHFNGT